MLSPSSASGVPTFRAGTLVYTRMGLISLFVWLLWGDFVFTMMEAVEPRILPLLLKDHGASDKEIAVIVSTIAALLNALINPIVSFRSDRTRSRFGRRIPYLMFATPFVAFFLAMIPFAPELADAALRVPWLATFLHMFPIAPVILMFGLLVVLFQIFNMMVSSVYYYLFRDVVPLDHLGRFMSLFRMCGFVAGFVFNYWIFGLAETHSREIFVGIAIIYAVGFMLMCWRVREGEYTPVDETEKSTGGLIQAIRNYTRQSFGAPIYCWMYVTRMFILSAGISATFSVFFARDQLGLNLDTIGKMAAWPSLLCLPLAYPFGMLMDKWGSIRTLRLTLWLTISANIAGFFFVQGQWTLLAFGTLITSAAFVSNIAQSVWLQKLFHHERLGQLSSASALVAALAGVFMGPLCGQFFGWVGDYRYIYIWPIFFIALALFGLSQVHRQWLRLGGMDSYQPPLPGEPDPH